MLRHRQSPGKIRDPVLNMTPHLCAQVDRIVDETGTGNAAIAFHDYQTQTSWNYRGNVYFHAASTIKVAILAGIFALVDEGVIRLDFAVHVRNRFFSLVNNELYRIRSSSDACSSLYASLGKTLPVEELAYHMIVTSSNLATNLLIDLAGVSTLREKLDDMGVRGIDLGRGVEDELAFEERINNRATANGLSQLFSIMYENRGLCPESAKKMLQILSDQKFNQGLPIGIPPEQRKRTRFAHKTGEISTISHDAGLVFLPGREPYSLAILTERPPGKSNSWKVIQRLSRLVYRNFVDPGIQQDSPSYPRFVHQTTLK